MDKLIESQRTELECGAAQGDRLPNPAEALAINPAVNFVSERLVALSWPYVKDFPLDASDGYQHRLANCWLDQTTRTSRDDRPI